MVVPSLAWPEFAVAKTLGVSFFGFLASLLPLFFSLDILRFLSVPGKLPRGRAGTQDIRGGPLGFAGGACRVKMGVRAGEDKRGAGCVGHLEFATTVQPAPLCPESRRECAAGPRPTSPREGAFATVASRNSGGGVER